LAVNDEVVTEVAAPIIGAATEVVTSTLLEYTDSFFILTL
jgi:hypothetical protein